MISFFYLLVLLGSLQGIINAVLLFTKRTTPNRLLAFVLLLIAMPGLHYYAHHINFYNRSLFTQLTHVFIPWTAIMALGPCLYLYIRTSNGYSLQRKDLLHFIPFIIDLLPKGIEILFLVGLLPNWSSEQLGNVIDTYNQYADLPRWLSMAIYVQLSGKYTSQVKRLERFILIMKLFMILWLIYLIPYLIPGFKNTLLDAVGWFPIYIPLSILIYWIGITAMAASTKNAGKKGESNMYTIETLAATAAQLTSSMAEQKLYLDPSLDLGSLSFALQIPQKLISATVNQHLNKSFNQFVNEYRVEAFKKRILLTDAANMTIAGLAAECGFPSSATFQRSFKQVTGITPSEYMRGGDIGR